MLRSRLFKFYSNTDTQTHETTFSQIAFVLLFTKQWNSGLVLNDPQVQAVSRAGNTQWTVFESPRKILKPPIQSQTDILLAKIVAASLFRLTLCSPAFSFFLHLVNDACNGLVWAGVES